MILTLIQEALPSTEIMDLDLAETMASGQHLLGEILLIQSVLAPDGVANQLASKTPSLRRGCFIRLPSTFVLYKQSIDHKKHLLRQIY